MEDFDFVSALLYDLYLWFVLVTQLLQCWLQQYLNLFLNLKIIFGFVEPVQQQK